MGDHQQWGGCSGGEGSAGKEAHVRVRPSKTEEGRQAQEQSSTEDRWLLVLQRGFMILSLGYK